MKIVSYCIKTLKFYYNKVGNFIGTKHVKIDMSFIISEIKTIQKLFLLIKEVEKWRLCARFNDWFHLLKEIWENYNITISFRHQYFFQWYINVMILIWKKFVFEPFKACKIYFPDVTTSPTKCEAPCLKYQIDKVFLVLALTWALGLTICVRSSGTMCSRVLNLHLSHSDSDQIRQALFEFTYK